MSELKILVVDDNDDKRRRVVATLKDKLAAHELYVREATDYESSLNILTTQYFDLVVLDLLLPGAGSGPTEVTSRALVQAINRGSLIAPLYIIGLTEHREIGEQERAYYDANLFALEFYSPTESGWADRIVAKIGYLVRSKDAAVNFAAHSFSLDVFVLAARYENEFLPIKRQLFSTIDSEDHPLWNGKIVFGSMNLHDGRTLKGALACIAEMGMAPAAAVSAQAISTFRPRLIAMLGMCCGFTGEVCSVPQKLLDAIVVRQVACWEEGKYAEKSDSKAEFKNRAKVRFVDDEIRESIAITVEEASQHIIPRLRKLAGRKEHKLVKKHFGDAVRDLPEVRFGALVTGSSVIADEAVVREIIQRHPAAIGLDMEIYGVFTAAERCYGKRPSVIGVKGVADFGHSTKDDFAQRAASRVSAEVFKSLLPQLPIFRKA